MTPLNSTPFGSYSQNGNAKPAGFWRSGPPFGGQEPKPEKDKRQARLQKQAEKGIQVIPAKNEDYSIWRDTALRYGGYADEVGEFLTPYLGSVGTFLGYGISSGYVAADMLTTLPKKFKEADPSLSTGKKVLQTAKEGVDLSVFHLIATLLVPPMLIGAVVKTAGTMLANPGEAAKVTEKLAHPVAPGGFSPLKAIEKVRGGIEDVLEKMVSTVIPHTQRWTESYVEAAHNRFIGEAGNKSASGFIRRHGQKISKVIQPVAKTAEFLSNKPVLNMAVSKELAKELAANVTAIATKEGFKVETKELARLLFVKPLPVMVGIGMVPLIAHPFDELLLKVQDWTIRPLLGKNKIIRDKHGRLKSVKNPKFWGHQPKASVEIMPANQRRNPGVFMVPPGMIRRGHPPLQAKARFGYFQTTPGLKSNQLYPKHRLADFPLNVPPQPLADAFNANLNQPQSSPFSQFWLPANSYRQPGQ